jgi:signal transduction histidine kinase
LARLVLNRLNRSRLRRWLLGLFFALALPSGVLVYQAYDQLKWEAFHRHQVLAEELSTRIDKRYAELIEAEERRAFVDYNFLVVAGDPKSNYIQRSPLSSFPVQSSIPGLIGYFQVDAQGLFRTPLLPDSERVAAEYGIRAGELAQRQALADRVYAILSENRLVRQEKRDYAARLRRKADASPAKPKDKEEFSATLSSNTALPSAEGELLMSEEKKAAAQEPIAEEMPVGQAVFDHLAEQEVRRKQATVSASKNLGRVEDLQLDGRFQTAQEPQRQRLAEQKKSKLLQKRVTRTERGALPEPDSAPAASGDAMVRELAQAPPLRVRTFESEIDPFEMSLLDSGHIVLYRKVWRDNQRYIQGALIEQKAFLSGVIEASFRETSLERMSDLIAAYQGEVLAAYSADTLDSYTRGSDQLSGELLHRSRLSTPVDGLELIFTLRYLPAGPGAGINAWVSVILFLVLSGGFYGIYRLGLGQINLLDQQQDFVSAVSHELKTPLTSIRMYGEMLREGWAPADKQREYYDYIYDESERLTRLINNVLQLARMTRNDLKVQLKSVSVAELVDMIRSKIATQVARAGFNLRLDCPPECESHKLQIDPDYFTQIIINLVDNAIKFSVSAQTKAVDIQCRQLQEGGVMFKVRDYGPGIPKDQLKKIFKLFYRTESELTRETVGTGIGLALVKQLSASMNGTIDVINVDPGAEFRLSFD